MVRNDRLSKKSKNSIRCLMISLLYVRGMIDDDGLYYLITTVRHDLTFENLQ